MPEIEFSFYKGNAFVTSLGRREGRSSTQNRYAKVMCSSAWELFQAINEHVQKPHHELSTVRLNVPPVPGFYETLADPGLEWHALHPDRLLVLPKHSQDMEEMEAFSVELWELALELTRREE